MLCWILKPQLASPQQLPWQASRVELGRQLIGETILWQLDRHRGTASPERWEAISETALSTRIALALAIQIRMKTN